jgi:Tfp pilus assembly protein PilF
LIGSLVLFAFGAFTKEPAICLPLMIGAYELFIRTGDAAAKRLKTGLLYSAPYLLISLVYFAARQTALGFLLSDPSYSKHTYGQSFLTIPLVFWKYIGLLFWPVDLSLFHATPVVTSVLSPRFYLPVLGLAGLAVLIAKLWHSIVARFGILWFLINLLPVLNLKAFSTEFMVQERYIYTASLGFSLLIAMAIVRIPLPAGFTMARRRIAVGAGVAVILLLMTGKTLAQNNVWKDDLSLWVHGAEVAPEQPMSAFILGHRYLAREQFDLATQEFERYVALNPRNLIVLSNLAAAHLYAFQSQSATNPATADRARLDRAIALCEKGLALASFGPLWDTLGTCYTFENEFKNLDRAIACYDRGIREQPENAMLLFHKGAVLMKKGSYDQAIPYLQAARDIQPDLPDVYKMLGYTQQAKGQFNDAIGNLTRYLQLQPNAFDATQVKEQIETLRALTQQPTSQS